MKARRRSYLWGHAAEYLCMALLIMKGYSLLGRRERNHLGEIDIVAARGRTLAFIEVKAREDANDALASVTAAKRQRLMQAAQRYLVSRPAFARHDLRFDVMVVTSPWKIRHLKDAWRS